MHLRERARRKDQRLRRAQAIADELRENRVDLSVDWAVPGLADRRLLVVDFHQRRALHGREALDALSAFPGVPDDVC